MEMFLLSTFLFFFFFFGSFYLSVFVFSLRNACLGLGAGWFEI